MNDPSQQYEEKKSIEPEEKKGLSEKLKNFLSDNKHWIISFATLITAVIILTILASIGIGLPTTALAALYCFIALEALDFLKWVSHIFSPSQEISEISDEKSDEKSDEISEGILEDILTVTRGAKMVFGFKFLVFIGAWIFAYAVVTPTFPVSAFTTVCIGFALAYGTIRAIAAVECCIQNYCKKSSSTKSDHIILKHDSVDREELKHEPTSDRGESPSPDNMDDDAHRKQVNEANGASCLALRRLLGGCPARLFTEQDERTNYLSTSSITGSNQNDSESSDNSPLVKTV